MQRKRTTLLAATALAVAGLALSTGTALAAPIVEDFSGYSVGTDLVGVGGWDSATPSDIIAEVKDDPVNTGNNVGFFQRLGGGPATPSLYLDLGANTISDGAMGEFSVRFMLEGPQSSVFGLSTLTNPGPASGYGAGTQLLVDFRIGGDTSPGNDDLIYMTDQSRSVGPTLALNLLENTWYELSATIDNAANTVSNFFLDGALIDGGAYSFNAGAAQDLGDLRTFFVYEQGFVQGIYLDDIAVGEIASVSSVPEPASVLLLATGFGLMLLARTRKAAEGDQRA